MGMTKEELLQKYRERKETLNTGNEDYEKLWANLATGNNFLRFFPNPKDGGLYTEALLHRNLNRLGVTDSKQAYCPKSYGNKKARCPICELLADLSNGGPEDQETVKQCKAKVHFLSYVGRLDSPKNIDLAEGDNVRVLGYGPQILDQLLGFYLDPEWGDFTDLETGSSVTIERVGEKMNTSYTVRLRPKPSAFDVDLSDLKPIEEVVVPRDYNGLCKLLGMEVEDEKAPKAPAGKRRKVDEEDDDDAPPKRRRASEPEEEVEQEEEEEQPRRSSKAKPSKSESDEEAPPRRRGKSKEKDDEEEEEEKPPKRRSSRKAQDDDDEEEKPKKASGDRPKGSPTCYGDKETFNPRDQTCKDCAFVKPCKAIYLEA
jgi:hypothetical protein